MQVKEVMHNQLSFGEPQVIHGLGVVPILTANGIPEMAPMDLLEEALKRGTLMINEISEAGSVPTLRVQNSGNRACLLLESEIVHGGKQTRTLNTSVIVLPHATIQIPVACVERGRWGHRDHRRNFESTSSMFRAKSRIIQKSGVTANVRLHQDYRADQGAVWNEVDQSLDQAGVRSSTSSFKDAQDRVAHDVDEFVNAVRLPSNSIGAVFCDQQGVIGAELLATTDLLSRALPKVVRSFAWEVLGAPDLKAVDVESVHNWWATVLDAPVTKHASPGSGKDIRIATDKLIASGLVFKRHLIHFSAFPLQGNPQNRPRTPKGDRAPVSQRKRRMS